MRTQRFEVGDDVRERVLAFPFCLHVTRTALVASAAGSLTFVFRPFIFIFPRRCIYAWRGRVLSFGHSRLQVGASGGFLLFPSRLSFFWAFPSPGSPILRSGQPAITLHLVSDFGPGLGLGSCADATVSVGRRRLCMEAILWLRTSHRDEAAAPGGSVAIGPLY